MKILQTILSTFLFMSIVIPVIGQELNCKVTVQTVPQASIQADSKVFETLESSIEEFMNSTSWTDVTYQLEERINCNIQITLSIQEGENTFKGSIAIQSTRPVYNSDYQTPVFIINDNNFKINYKEFQPITHVKNSFQDNLSSILSYYAYIILGYDGDTFSELGGEKYFRMAEAIRNAASSSNGDDPGWDSSNRTKSNRYNLIEDIFSSKFTKFREAMYIYHRRGLDVLSDELEVGRTNIEKAVQELSYLSLNNTSLPMIFLIFFDSKDAELVKIFEPASVASRSKMYRLLVDMNPVTADRFSQLK